MLLILALELLPRLRNSLLRRKSSLLVLMSFSYLTGFGNLPEKSWREKKAEKMKIQKQKQLVTFISFSLSFISWSCCWWTDLTGHCRLPSTPPPPPPPSGSPASCSSPGASSSSRWCCAWPSSPGSPTPSVPARLSARKILEFNF